MFNIDNMATLLTCLQVTMVDLFTDLTIVDLFTNLTMVDLFTNLTIADLFTNLTIADLFTNLTIADLFNFKFFVDKCVLIVINIAKLKTINYSL